MDWTRPGPRGLVFRMAEDAPKVHSSSVRSLYDRFAVGLDLDAPQEVMDFFWGLRLRPPLTETLRSFEFANLRLPKAMPDEAHLAQAYHQGAPVEDLDAVELGELAIVTDPRILAALAIAALPLPEVVALFGDPVEALKRVEQVAQVRAGVRTARKVVESAFFPQALERTTSLVVPPDEPVGAWHPAYDIWAPAPPPRKYIRGFRAWGGRVVNPRWGQEEEHYGAEITSVAALRELAKRPARPRGRPKKEDPPLEILALRAAEE